MGRIKSGTNKLKVLDNNFSLLAIRRIHSLNLPKINDELLVPFRHWIWVCPFLNEVSIVRGKTMMAMYHLEIDPIGSPVDNMRNIISG